MIQRRYWLYALFIALSIHAAGVMFVFTADTDDGAKLAGEQGIEIDLGMIGDLGETEETEPEKAPEPTPEPEPEPEPVPVKEPEPEPVVEPEPIIKPEPVQAKQQTETKVKKAPKPEPKPEPEPEPVVEPEPIVTPKKKPTVASTVRTKDTQSQQAKQKQTTGRANSITTGGQVAARQSYFSLLAATLAKHKRYPTASRRRGEEGVVKLFFVVDRTGAVLDYKITQSSGSARLDDAVIRMLKKASPLPAFPSAMQQQQLEVNVPIAFHLNVG
ncbi:energy transducer TonB [Methylophaga thiooxydans]|uniref:energy transducer TonB n=1 Tax=Methylophaga thiooxydans TaxID=392484 RepID=UPI0023574CBE|nr:energy transducer TonB [Methylophaga thiooxydans]